MIYMDRNFDKQYLDNTTKVIVGVDEAGRGCLCGPVVAAAVILKPDFYDSIIDDSKKLTSAKREKAYKLIISNAVSYGVGIIDADTIDNVNIYEASRLAMLKAISNLNCKFDIVLTDAMPLKDETINCVDIIKGDSKSLSIAAASIIAKVTRDHIMLEYDKKYPQYDLKTNKGYGTKKHLEALAKYGPIKHFHRYTYKPIQRIIDPIYKLF